MTDRIVTARSKTYTGTIAGYTFVPSGGTSTVTVDDSTTAGQALIAFAKRHGWAVSGGVNSAIVETPAQGKPIAEWTAAELKAYLDAFHVNYPSGASTTDLRNAVLTAYETRAQGGSAALPTAGHTQGTFPVLDAPDVPGDDTTKTPNWHPPVTGADSDVLPTISDQPDSVSKVAGQTATFTLVATGTPTPTIQWQRRAKGVGAYVDLDGATSASYITPALTVADNNGDTYRAILSNRDGQVTSSVATLTVTAE